MQYCPNCGKQIPDGVEFCPYCGAKISYSEDSQTSNEYIEANDRDNTASTPKKKESMKGGFSKSQNQPSSHSAKDINHNGAAKNKTKYTNIGILLLIVLLIFIGGIWYTYMNTADNRTFSQSVTDPQSKINEAYDAYQKAFKKYTSMVTTSPAPDESTVQKALQEYRNSYARYKKIKNAQDGSTPKLPKKNGALDTAGVDGIVAINPSDVENNIAYIERLRSHKENKSVSVQHKIIGVVFGLDSYGDGFLSIREKPNSTKIGELYNGDKVEILDKKGKWFKIRAIKSGIVGWSYSDWIHVH